MIIATKNSNWMFVSIVMFCAHKNMLGSYNPYSNDPTVADVYEVDHKSTSSFCSTQQPCQKMCGATLEGQQKSDKNTYYPETAVQVHEFDHNGAPSLYVAKFPHSKMRDAILQTKKKKIEGVTFASAAKSQEKNMIFHTYKVVECSDKGPLCFSPLHSLFISHSTTKGLETPCYEIRDNNNESVSIDEKSSADLYGRLRHYIHQIEDNHAELSYANRYRIKFPNNRIEYRLENWIYQHCITLITKAKPSKMLQEQLSRHYAITPLNEWISSESDIIGSYELTAYNRAGSSDCTHIKTIVIQHRSDSQNKDSERYEVRDESGEEIDISSAAAERLYRFVYQRVRDSFRDPSLDTCMLFGVEAYPIENRAVRSIICEITSTKYITPGTISVKIPKNLPPLIPYPLGLLLGTAPK